MYYFCICVVCIQIISVINNTYKYCGDKMIMLIVIQVIVL